MITVCSYPKMFAGLCTMLGDYTIKFQEKAQPHVI